MLEDILKKAQAVFKAGLARAPYDYLYLDRRALDEHCQALTGVVKLPLKLTRSAKAGGGLELFGLLEAGASGSVESTAELGPYHLFESLEPELRTKYAAAEGEAALAGTIGKFIWIRGDLSWERIGPVESDGREVEPARLFHIFVSGGMTLMLACNDESFSPFVPFLTESPELYKLSFPVELLAFNPGVLGQYGVNVAPRSGRSLVLVPTVIIGADKRASAERAEWVRKLNDGKLSRSFDA
jgi:hypothetical protein